MIYQITSRQNDKIKELVKLSDTKFSKEMGLFKIEGFHALEMAVKAKVVKSVFLLKEDKELPKEIDQYIVSKEIMEKISETKNPQGAVVVCEYLKSSQKFDDKVLYLDGVSDPGNLGTILRTAVAFGYNDIILSNGCVSQYNDKVLQASQGAIFKLNIVKNFDLSKLNGYQILATEIKGSVDLDEIKPNKKHVLVLGNEAHGVSESILKLADKRIRIDIENIESLNVAIAGAIAMYKLSR